MAEAFTEDFRGSAVRHWLDATLLEKERRHANANQLFGLAAECALKTALCQLPGFVKDGKLVDAELVEHYREHVNILWGRIKQQGIQKRFPALFALLKKPNPFHDWRIGHRYAREGTVSEEASQRHRDMAKRLLPIVGINGMRAGS